MLLTKSTYIHVYHTSFKRTRHDVGRHDDDRHDADRRDDDDRLDDIDRYNNHIYLSDPKVLI
jgi:hypothetical protein